MKVYDETIAVLKSAVQKAHLGHSDELAALRRLDHQACMVEREASGPSIATIFAAERALSHDYGGRSVFGDEPPPTAVSDSA
jgi:hypothetical protein